MHILAGFKEAVLIREGEGKERKRKGWGWMEMVRGEQEKD